MQHPKPVSGLSGFPAPCHCDYGVPETESGDDVRDGEISEADLRTQLDGGGAIRRVVIVELASTGEFVPFFRLAGRPGFLRLATRRYEGAKGWADFRTLRRSIVSKGYDGCLAVCREGNPLLARLGIATGLSGE